MKTAPVSLVPFGRLLWKEYRAVRGFWLALVVLVVLIQFIAISFSQDIRDSMGLVYNFALGAPAFFAIGCAGAAFAMEQEEGTFEFLRAGPATSRQVFLSKLALALFATLAMFSLLLPIALWFMKGQLPENPVFGGMLGLWLVAALEAIAWGTLFSLLTARPLFAICLGIAATSTFAHLLAWTKAPGPLGDFSYAPYLQAVPVRLLVAGLILLVDVYLGRCWLRTLDESRGKPKPTTPASSKKTTSKSAETTVSATSLAARADHSAMLGHLLWQNWRQSWRLMVVSPLMLIVVLLFTTQWHWIFLQSLGWLFGDNHRFIPLAMLTTLMGCCVFLADQENRQYRFFVEHNVPPRYVWLTRQISWSTLAAIVATSFWWLLVSHEDWAAFQRILNSNTDPWLWNEMHYGWPRYPQFPPLHLILGSAAVSYAAGQWASMLVRSGLMAAVLGLLLSVVLCGWVFLMDTMRVSFWWSVWPIPLVLIFATWMRAPDWVRENKRWSARLCAAAAVIIPAAVLLVTVPFYRVHQIPMVDAGFDPEGYLAEITPEALETGELYRKAADKVTEMAVRVNALDVGGTYREQMERLLEDNAPDWARENEEVISLLRQAIERQSCCLDNLRKQHDYIGFQNADSLFLAMIVSAWELEEEGKLDEALDRYFDTLKMLSQWGSHGPYVYVAGYQVHTLEYISRWASYKGQTPKLIQRAISRLQKLTADTSQYDDLIKTHYILTRRFLHGDSYGAIALVSRGANISRAPVNFLWSKLMPWENDRALRMLNLLTLRALDRLRQMRILWNVDDGVIKLLPPMNGAVLDYFEIWHREMHSKNSIEAAEWLETTSPYLGAIGSTGIQAAYNLADFEAQRRATMLILALQAYRLENGKLPASLSELVGTYFDKLPLDPYSGKEFDYFPGGIRPPEDVAEASYLTERTLQTRGKPGIWCSGRELQIHTWSDIPHKDEQTGKDMPGTRISYFTYRTPGLEDRRVSSYEAWSRGMWFHIPEPRK